MANKRGPQERFYINDSREIVCRINKVDTVCDINSATDPVLIRLAQEGYIRLRHLNHTHDEIIAGKICIDRTLPAGPVAKVKKERAQRITKKVKAIADQRLQDMVKDALLAGNALLPEQFHAMQSHALSWAQSFVASTPAKAP